jgi:hypothetical protein
MRAANTREVRLIGQDMVSARVRTQFNRCSRKSSFDLYHRADIRFVDWVNGGIV